MNWVLEPSVFREPYGLPDAAKRAGHRVVLWQDDWSPAPERAPALDGPVVFHGSLGIAAGIQHLFPWRPGAFCNVDAFTCSGWYPLASRWLLHRTWTATTVAELVAAPPDVDVFVRPDSPLKPFSGRVLKRGCVSLAALDCGFYYDDVNLSIIVAPVRSVGREWRYVVVNKRVVAGSAYQADGRAALADDPSGEPWRYAADVAASMPRPEAVYVLDIAEADGDLHLIEVNPFSGADLYACNADAIVNAVAEVACDGASR